MVVAMVDLEEVVGVVVPALGLVLSSGEMGLELVGSIKRIACVFWSKLKSFIVLNNKERRKTKASSGIDSINSDWT